MKLRPEFTPRSRGRGPALFRGVPGTSAGAARRKAESFLVALALPVALLLATPARAAIEQQHRAKPAPKAEAPTPVLTKPPELLELFTATYPPELLARGEGGEAILLIDIAADGTVDGVQVQSATDPAFGEAAMLAATRFVFSPAEVDGVPSPIRIEYQYVFTPEAPLPDAVAGEVGPAAAAPVTLAGTVREAGSRRPITGAIVEVDGTALAETDATGRFEVRGVPPGKHRVKASSRSHDSYATDADIAPDERLELTLYLVRKSGDPFETVVRTRQERQEVQRIELERQEVARVPGTMGDPIRVIENLPGLARTPGGLGGALLVRGTPPADTAVFVDGVQIPLLYHFFGLTSVVNPEYLDSIDFYPGGFGARYGRATAGVVEVKSRDIQCEQWRGVGEISVLLSHGYLCAPISGGWAVAAAGRRSYVDLLLPLVMDQVQNDEPGQGSATVSPLFWDYQVKAERKAGAHVDDVFAFGSDDKLKFIQTGSAEDVNFGLRLHTNFHRLLLRDRWQLGERTTLSSSLAPGFERQGFSLGSDLDSSTEVGVDVWSLEWREDFSHEVSDTLTLHAGLDHRFGHAQVSLQAPIPTELRRYPSPTFDYTNVQSYVAEPDDYSQGYWAEAILKPARGLQLVGGLRLDYFDFEGQGHFELQPRATVRWEVVPGTTAKAAYGLYEKLPEPQYMLPGIGNPYLEPERAHQFIVGAEHRFAHAIDLDLSAFYNLRQRLRSYTSTIDYGDESATRPRWTNDGTGHSYGIELLLRRLPTPDGIFYGWIAYTLSRSWQRDHPEPVDDGTGEPGGFDADHQADEWYLVPFDQTHILTVVGQWTLPWGFEAGFRFRLTSGNPFTPLDQGVATWDADLDRYRIDTSGVARDEHRMPTFHQLDVRIDKSFTFDLWKLAVYVEVLNVYNAHNVETYQYDYRYRERVPLTLLPIVPTIGIRGEF